MNRAEVIEFYGTPKKEEDHKFEDDGNEKLDTINICDKDGGDTFLVLVRSLDLKGWHVSVT